jgi:hypothetical protein
MDGGALAVREQPECAGSEAEDSGDQKSETQSLPGGLTQKELNEAE